MEEDDNNALECYLPQCDLPQNFDLGDRFFSTQACDYWIDSGVQSGVSSHTTSVRAFRPDEEPSVVPETAENDVDSCLASLLSRLPLDFFALSAVRSFLRESTERSDLARKAGATAKVLHSLSLLPTSAEQFFLEDAVCALNALAKGDDNTKREIVYSPAMQRVFHILTEERTNNMLLYWTAQFLVSLTSVGDLEEVFIRTNLVSMVSARLDPRSHTSATRECDKDLCRPFLNVLANVSHRLCSLRTEMEQLLPKLNFILTSTTCDECLDRTFTILKNFMSFDPASRPSNKLMLLHAGTVDALLTLLSCLIRSQDRTQWRMDVLVKVLDALRTATSSSSPKRHPHNVAILDRFKERHMLEGVCQLLCPDLEGEILKHVLTLVQNLAWTVTLHAPLRDANAIERLATVLAHWHARIRHERIVDEDAMAILRTAISALGELANNPTNRTRMTQMGLVPEVQAIYTAFSPFDSKLGEWSKELLEKLAMWCPPSETRDEASIRRSIHDLTIQISDPSSPFVFPPQSQLLLNSPVGKLETEQHWPPRPSPATPFLIDEMQTRRDGNGSDPDLSRFVDVSLDLQEAVYFNNPV